MPISQKEYGNKDNGEMPRPEVVNCKPDNSPRPLGNNLRHVSSVDLFQSHFGILAF